MPGSLSAGSGGVEARVMNLDLSGSIPSRYGTIPTLLVFTFSFGALLLYIHIRVYNILSLNPCSSEWNQLNLLVCR